MKARWVLAALLGLGLGCKGRDETQLPAPATAPGAKLAGPTLLGTVPVFDAADLPVLPSRARVVSVAHDLKLTAGKDHLPLSLHSSFDFAAASLADAGGAVLFDGPDLGDVEVLSAKVDGHAVTPETLRPKPWTLKIALPPAPAKQTKRLVEITYRSGVKADSLVRIGHYKLLRPARLVQIDGKTGWDLRPLSPFSYADRLPTTLKVEPPKGYVLLAPSSLRPASLAQPVVVLGKKGEWTTTEFQVMGAVFRAVLPAKHPEIKASELKAIVGAAWPKLSAKLGTLPRKTFTFVQTDDGSLSGGLLGDDVVGLFVRSATSPFEQIYIRNVLGWEPAGSTRDYVTREYKGAKDPWNDYLTGMVTHELAHFWFGFGKTSERVVETHDEWTSLGLGLVYDNEVTKALTGREPALFVASEKVWQTKWAKDAAIDQRLEHPDTKADPPALARTQTYAHSKALWTFRQLRAKLGPATFDRAVHAYLAASPDDPDQGWTRLARELQKVAPGFSAAAKDLGL